MTEESLWHLTDDELIESFEKNSNILSDRQCNIDHLIGNTMTKLEREALFNQAENLRLEGHKNDSADLYMRCLFSLEVKTAFPSLPRCLRALANFFLEKKQYVKAIHFVQAERLYYESALLDTATLQQKLIDITSGKISKEERINSPIAEMCKQDLLNSKSRLVDYDLLVNYFKEKKSLESALCYAQKGVRLTMDVYGSESRQTKDRLRVVQDLADDIAREKISLNHIGDVKETITRGMDDKVDVESSKKYGQSKIFNITKFEIKENGAVDEGDKDGEGIGEEGYVGRSVSVSSSGHDKSDTTVYSSSHNHVVKSTMTTNKRGVMAPVLLIISRFIVISIIFIVGCTIVLVLANHLLLSLHKSFFPEHKWLDDIDDNKVTDNIPVTLHTEYLLRPIAKFLTYILRLMSADAD